MEYLRIGTKYYRLINYPFQNEDGQIITEKRIVTWKRGTILEDHGRDFLSTGVAKFDNKHTLPKDILELYEKLPKSQRWLGK